MHLGRPMWLGSIQLNMGGKWYMPPSEVTFNYPMHLQPPLPFCSDLVCSRWHSTRWKQPGSLSHQLKKSHPTLARHIPLCVKLLKFWVHLLASPNKCNHLVRLQPLFYFSATQSPEVKWTTALPPHSGTLLLSLLHMKNMRTNVKCISHANQM